MLYSCTRIATVGVKGLIIITVRCSGVTQRKNTHQNANLIPLLQNRMWSSVSSRSSKVSYYLYLKTAHH